MNPVVSRWRAGIGLVDVAMLALAAGSVSMLLWMWLTDPAPEVVRRVIAVDIGVCVVFAAEFGWRWSRSGWTAVFLRRNWYELVGMVPISHPALRGFRMLRLFVLVVRLMRTADRAIADQFTIRLVRRFAGGIVEALKRPITVAILDEVSAVLAAGHYSRNVATALEANRFELRTMIRDKLRDDPQFGRLRRVPFYNEIVESVTEATLRVVQDMLNDPRTDELIADLLRENVTQIRAAVAAGRGDAGRAGEPAGEQPATAL